LIEAKQQTAYDTSLCSIRSLCNQSKRSHFLFCHYYRSQWFVDTGENITSPKGLPVATFTQVVLFTDTDGCAKWREEKIALSEGKPEAMLSTLVPSGGMQLRYSPVGFRSPFHCTTTPQWVFILGGQMEIGLQDGTSRIFKAGDHFYSNDVLPSGATFDAKIHGHWSRQLGDKPLITAFVRA
jgi:hypothetical protein